MNITYIDSKQPRYQIIQYDVTIYNEDDGAHFPMYNYSDTIIFSGRESYKSEQEIYDIALSHFMNNYEKHVHMTLEEQAKDPAFRGINIRVSSTVSYQKQIDIKP